MAHLVHRQDNIRQSEERALGLDALRAVAHERPWRSEPDDVDVGDHGVKASQENLMVLTQGQGFASWVCTNGVHARGACEGGTQGRKASDAWPDDVDVREHRVKASQEDLGRQWRKGARTVTSTTFILLSRLLLYLYSLFFYFCRGCC